MYKQQRLWQMFLGSLFAGVFGFILTLILVVAMSMVLAASANPAPKLANDILTGSLYTLPALAIAAALWTPRQMRSLLSGGVTFMLMFVLYSIISARVPLSSTSNLIACYVVVIAPVLAYVVSLWATRDAHPEGQHDPVALPAVLAAVVFVVVGVGIRLAGSMELGLLLGSVLASALGTFGVWLLRDEGTADTVKMKRKDNSA
ncbi:MAG: hypothetical protein AAF125_14400 [Chloroflexota bacterium]